jgi:hypothetical protein
VYMQYAPTNPTHSNRVKCSSEVCCGSSKLTKFQHHIQTFHQAAQRVPCPTHWKHHHAGIFSVSDNQIWQHVNGRIGTAVSSNSSLAISGGSILQHESEDDSNKMIFPHEMNFSQGTFSIPDFGGCASNTLC